MPSRRTHTKSRHGCVDCKARKVKCDETRPSCLRCVTRQTTCLYAEPFRSNNLQETPFSPSTPSQISNVSTPSNQQLPHPVLFPFAGQHVGDLSPNALQAVFQSHATSATTSSSICGESTPPNGRRNWDMELLHHYSTSADIIICRTPEQTRVWTLLIPKAAFSNSFLLHGLLSLAAAHLSQVPLEGQTEIQDMEEYANLAKYHYTTGLSLFRPLLNYINEENAAPIVSFSMLLIVIVMAMPPKIEPDPVKPSAYVEKMADSLFLINGVRQVLSLCWPHIQQSFLAAAIGTDRESNIDALGFEAEVALRYIEARIHSDIFEVSLKEEYLSATKYLRACNPAKNSHVGMQEDVVLAWPALISIHFFGEIKAEKPVALAIFAFYGTMMHKLDEIWWLTGKGKRMVEATTELLPRGWESVIVWAKMSVGLPCDYTPLT